MEEKLSGIVLNGISLGDYDMLLNIFTLEKGVISAKIKGVKKAGAKLKFASSPFCFAQFVFSNSNEKRTVIGASLIDSFYPIREDLVKYYAGATVLEYLRRFLKEGIVAEDMFVLTVDTLKRISYSDENVLAVLIRFLIDAVRFSGFRLNNEGCCICRKEIEHKIYFDYSVGGFFCEDCKNDFAREVSIITYKSLNKILDGKDCEKADALKVLKLLDFYLENKLEIKINSLKELIKIINL